MTSLLDHLTAALAGPTREQMDTLGFTDVPVARPEPSPEALALAVCDWLREQGETYRGDGPDFASGWVHVFIGSICDEIALASDLPARYREAAEATRRGKSVT
jgi:hypothetical protein